jgi:hypothetical protein
MAGFRKGQRVRWRWGSGTGEGTVVERFTDRVERQIAGTTVVRDADADNPAYLIEQDGRTRVLKSESELSGA